MEGESTIGSAGAFGGLPLATDVRLSWQTVTAKSVTIRKISAYYDSIATGEKGR